MSYSEIKGKDSMAWKAGLALLKSKRSCNDRMKVKMLITIAVPNKVFLEFGWLLPIKKRINKAPNIGKKIKLDRIGKLLIFYNFGKVLISK